MKNVQRIAKNTGVIIAEAIITNKVILLLFLSDT